MLRVDRRKKQQREIYLFDKIMHDVMGDPDNGANTANSKQNRKSPITKLRNVYIFV